MSDNKKVTLKRLLQKDLNLWCSRVHQSGYSGKVTFKTILWLEKIEEDLDVHFSGTQLKRLLDANPLQS
jgi:hypothetical protein